MFTINIEYFCSGFEPSIISWCSHIFPFRRSIYESSIYIINVRLDIVFNFFLHFSDFLLVLFLFFLKEPIFIFQVPPLDLALVYQFMNLI
jgi:hypothetical protein